MPSASIILEYDSAIASYISRTAPELDIFTELTPQHCINRGFLNRQSIVGTPFKRFESFVGRDYESSTLDINIMYPSQESWTQNDHEVVCAVYDMEANKLIGSAKGRGL